ncbi:MAG: FAD-dependent monooxygenase [Rhodobacter sp.]|jgi:4-hydroxyisophthalate hydroxylase|nr:FAD-dependent monooxygenase [Rhodobacter sp.]
MSIDFSKTYDVVIAGGGPVGLGLAIELGQRGQTVAVIERSTQLHSIPRGQNLTQRTMEHFHFWGAEAELRAARSVPKGYAIGGMTSYETLLSGYHYDWLQRDLVAPYYYCENERLPQYATEGVLRARAAEIAGIDIAYGWSGIEVSQDSEQASVLARHTDGQEKTLRGQYLVGCDGSRSAIGAAAGITHSKSDHDKLMVLLVFKSTGLHKLLERYPGKQFYCVLHPEQKGYWLFFGRVDLGSTWFFHAPVPLGTTRDNFDFKAFLERAVGAEIDVAFDHIGFWDLRIALADTYRKDRIFVAGDAAHSHPPYGGYGINTGFEDARNLGWKLAATLQGWGRPALLDTYGEERRPVFASTAGDFIERFIREDHAFLDRYNPHQDKAEFTHAWDTRNEGSTEVMAFEPNYDGASAVFGQAGTTPSAKGRHDFAARGGHHLAPAEMSDGSDAYVAMGAGFTLFAFAENPRVADAFQAAADTIGVPLNIVRDAAAPARLRYGSDFVLVRPDQFVVWAGNDAADPNEILRRATGRTIDA